MDTKRIALWAILMTTLVSGFAAGCGSLRSPGLVPPVESASYGEWVINRVGEVDGRWQLRAVYVPESESHLILGFDLVVTLDEEEMDFSFDEADQDLFFTSPADLPVGEHLFKLVPAEDATLKFPSLTILFQVE